MSRYINVVLNVPLNQTFTYLEPDETEKKNSFIPDNPFGHRVEVPFGNRKISGFVVSWSQSIPQSCKVSQDKIRHAVRYLDEEPLLTQENYEIAQFMSSYYISSIGECVFTMIPSGKRETQSPGFAFEEDETSFTKKELSEEQQKAVDGILDIENDGKKQNFHYLYGMTGSGKTEVFLTAAERVLQQGKGVIYLVPEIGLTPQVIEAVVNRFGKIAAVLHSELTPSQRLGEWKRILRKEARVVVGARSAVFAPVPDLGLIIIDEEHDSSYKSGSSPRYHARQIAMLRSTRSSFPLVMGSATPSVEAWKSMKDKSISCHTLTKRLAGGKQPSIVSINLSQEGAAGECISPKLYDEMKKTKQEGKQSILFLNRRGFTHFYRCSSCGFELKCRNCSVAMTYHMSENRLRCHYCGFVCPPPQQCPECGSLDTGYSGFGTEYIENEVKAKFPNAATIRLDTDSLQKKGEFQEKVSSFRKGMYDIMLGTQMVAKGLNFPKLKLVGVILADSTLHLPDFRASEKTFSLITQVAGRAGRFFPDGKVIVQSYSPDREAIKFAVKGDIDGFYNNELETRKLLNFPPYSRLLRLVFRSKSKADAQNACSQAAKLLAEFRIEGVEILGPAECPLETVNQNHRYQILLRGQNISPLIEAAKKLVWGYKAQNSVYIETDTDPQSLL